MARLGRDYRNRYPKRVADRLGNGVRHETQISIYGQLRELTTEQQMALWGSQQFYRVFSTVNGGRTLETDLFEGLR